MPDKGEIKLPPRLHLPPRQPQGFGTETEAAPSDADLHDTLQILKQSADIARSQSKLILSAATSALPASPTFLTSPLNSASTVPSSATSASLISPLILKEHLKRSSALKSPSDATHNQNNSDSASASPATTDSSGHNDIENNHLGRKGLPVRKRMRRNSPPQPLRLNKRRAVPAPIRSAPVQGRIGYLPPWYRAVGGMPMVHPIMHPVCVPVNSAGEVQLSVTPVAGVSPNVYAIPRRQAPAAKGKENQEKKESKSACASPAVSDVYASAIYPYLTEDQNKETEKDDNEEEDDDDDMESKAIEDGAEVHLESISGVVQLQEKAYNYKVIVTGDEEKDKKNFHDVMDVIWKNYRK